VIEIHAPYMALTCPCVSRFSDSNAVPAGHPAEIALVAYDYETKLEHNRF